MERPVGMRKWPLRLGIVLAIYLVHYFLFGYHFISGRVVDDETGKPIEGVVVLGVWKSSEAMGVTSVMNFTLSEDFVTNANGRFFLWGVWNPWMNRWGGWTRGDLTAYKRGYVAWNSLGRAFDGQRQDFRWKNGIVLRMEKWKEGYSYIEHDSFITWCTLDGKTKRFLDAIAWETAEYVREADRLNKQMGRGSK